MDACTPFKQFWFGFIKKRKCCWYYFLPITGIVSTGPRKPVLEKVKELVEDGATVIGTKPLKTPGLTGYPASDARVVALANDVWGDCDGQIVFHHNYGNGQVCWGIDKMEGILSEKGAIQDFQYTKPNFNTKINWIHRRTGSADIYFISNQRNQEEDLKLSFRISGKQPEIWHPDNGKAEWISYKMENGRNIIPLKMEANESFFVVFRKDVKSDHLELPVPQERLIQTIDGNWNVHFAPNRGAPDQITLNRLISWTEYENEGVTYFSGTATCNNEVSS